MKKNLGLGFLVLALPLMQGCNFNVQQLQSQVSATLQCTATTPNNYVVTSGVPVDLNVLITGGTIPYSLNVISRSINIQPTFSLNHVFINNTGTSQQQTFTFQVTDIAGNSANCVAQATVLPPSSGNGGSGGTDPTPAPTPAALACDMSSQPLSPEVNEETYLTATGSGGTPPYTFSTLTLGDPSGTILEPLQAQGDTSAVGAASYSQSGTMNITALLTDSAGNSATCALSMVVRQPQLQVTLNPVSGTAVDGTPITVTVNTTQFISGDVSSLDYYFYTTEPGISITSNGNVATVQATDGQAHSFLLNIAATDPNTGDSANTNVPLVFTDPQPALTCTVNVSARLGSLYPVVPYFYYYYNVAANVPASAAAVNPKVTGFSTDAFGYDYYASGSLSENVNFYRAQIFQPAQATVNLTLQIEDNTGRTASCSTSATVWEY